jgi:DinB family protein
MDLRYPIGPFTPVTPFTPAMRAAAIDDLAALPRKMGEAIDGLNDRQLDTPYRPGGWSVRQVVHHVADSHMNAFSRAKLALTEDTPTIKPYDEKAFALLADMRLPVDASLDLLDGLHIRLVAIFRSLAPEQYVRAFFHPELGRTLDLEEFLQSYSWHSRHHVAHITELRKREGW